MKRIWIAFALVGGVAAPAFASATTAAASVTILESATVPTIAALPAEALRQGDSRYRQVNDAGRDVADRRQRPTAWPIVIEFE